MTTGVRRPGWLVVGRGRMRETREMREMREMRQMRQRSRAGATVALTAALAGVLAALAGCTDTTRPEAGEPSPGSTMSSPPERPDPNFDRPHTSAGSELLKTFPAASDLGPGWGYPEGGPAGLERDVNDVVDGSVPDDCLRINPMPLPQAAAEVHYRFRGTPVIAFLVGFDNPAVNRAFLSLLVSNLEDCKDERGDDGADLIGQVVSLGEGTVLSDRYPEDPERRRADLAVRTKRSVVLLEAPAALGSEPFTSGDSVAIAEAFRKSAH